MSVWLALVALCARLGFPWARRRLDDEARQEFALHLDLLTERYIRNGLPPGRARLAARRQFGNLALLREEIHAMNGLPSVDGVLQDLKYAMRQMRHAPGFAGVVIATLALGIGGTTAMFGVARAVLLAPLPYGDPDQLVRIYDVPAGQGAREGTVLASHFMALRERASLVSELAGRRSDSRLTGLDLFREGQPQRLRVLQVTADYFQTLRAVPFRGLGFGPDDEFGTRRVVLSDGLFRTRFDSDLAIIGTTVLLSGEPYEIAGIASPGFADPVAGEVDVYLPHTLHGEQDTALHAVIGRVRPGVSREQLDAEITSLRNAVVDPEAEPGRLVAVPLHEDVVGPSRDMVYLLLVAVGLVLLVACINVANLALVRATAREHEFALRAALGSGRGRLARQLVVESLCLAGCGGMVGLAAASVGVNAVSTLGRDALPRLASAGIDPIVIGFGFLVTVATALVCGVVPALRVAGSDPIGALGLQPRSATGSRTQGRLRSALAAAQFALALALLAGAGVLGLSFYRLMDVPLGFRADNVLTFDLNLPDARYDGERRALFHETLAQQLVGIPGVIAAGATSRLPATGSVNPWPLAIESGPLAGTSVQETARREHRTVSGDYFKAFAIPVLAGRTFDERDDAAAPMRAVISANLARIAFPGMPLEGVVGQRIRVLNRRGGRVIIGVVGDVAVNAYGKPTGAVYSSHRQFAANRNWALTYAVSTTGVPEDVLPAIRRAVAALDPELVVHRAAPMTEIVGRGTSRQRFALILVGTFAGVCVVLAAMGLYGVLAYAVRQRTVEIGIRIAIGASAAHIRALVLRQAAIVLGVGVVAGVAGAIVLGRWLSSLLFQTNAWDPRVILATAAMLSITGAVAAWLPARRAARIAPTTAMQGM
jgi:predicted permease